MKKIIVEGGGFPGTSKTWRFIAEMISQNSQLVNNIAGDNVIVMGLEANGATAVTDGLIVLGGEFYPVEGGDVALEDAYLSISEDIEQTQYLKDLDGDGSGDLIDTYFDRFAVITNVTEGNVKLTDLKRLKSLKQLSERIPPQNCALPYWGSITAIPKGWQLCDGSNGTPDLSGKFLVGLDPNDEDHDQIGKAGGEKKHTLTEAEMPQHKHTGNTSTNGNHRHSFQQEDTQGLGQDGATDGESSFGIEYTSFAGSHSHSLSINNTGGSQSHENRPPYFTLAYITYTGI